MESLLGNKSNELKQQVARVAFLGFCERAGLVPEGNTGLSKWHLIGLKSVVLSLIYPLPLKETGYFVFAFKDVEFLGDAHFQMTDDNDREIGTLNLTVQSSNQQSDGLINQKRDIIQIRRFPNGWIIVPVSLHDLEFVISSPGTYHLNHITPTGREHIGQICYDVLNALPLTEDRIAAIKSDPSASKAIKMEIGCKHCDSKYRIYCALERKTKNNNFKWYEDIEDLFVCGCKKTNMNLAYIKKNMHGLLGQRKRDGDDLQFIPMYERGSLENVKIKFDALVNKSDREEELQIFLEENPVLLHQFSSDRIFHKPKILTDFIADFAIVTADKRLIFVELEKTTTKLLKKKGGMSSELSHAFDQVRSWLYKADEHRLSILDSLGIDLDEITSIAGVVIAGRNKGYDKKHLRALKSADYGRVSFLTYDDLGLALEGLIRKMDNL